MQRKQLHVTDESGDVSLKSRSRATGCTVSEFIRAAIEACTLRDTS